MFEHAEAAFIPKCGHSPIKKLRAENITSRRISAAVSNVSVRFVTFGVVAPGSIAVQFITVVKPSATKKIP
jgi:hypothetical protein